jgi:hypothetical protein
MSNPEGFAAGALEEVAGDGLARREGEMHMDAEGLDSQGRTVHTHIRFFDIAADRFSWESQASFDGGSHWFLAARLTATRSAR